MIHITDFMVVMTIQLYFVRYIIKSEIILWLVY